jgi:hypothetical protein
VKLFGLVKCRSLETGERNVFCDSYKGIVGNNKDYPSQAGYLKWGRL